MVKRRESANGFDAIGVSGTSFSSATRIDLAQKRLMEGPDDPIGGASLARHHGLDDVRALTPDLEVEFGGELGNGRVRRIPVAPAAPCETLFGVARFDSRSSRLMNGSLAALAY